jgi:hypothetical protein
VACDKDGVAGPPTAAVAPLLPLLTPPPLLPRGDVSIEHGWSLQTLLFCLPLHVPPSNFSKLSVILILSILPLKAFEFTKNPKKTVSIWFFKYIFRW